MSMLRTHMRSPTQDPLLSCATWHERARIFLARHGIGHWLTSLIVRAEIGDRAYSDTADPYVPPSALVDLYDRILAAPDETYKLLAEPVAGAEDDRVWFDVVEGLTHYPIIQAVTQTARNIRPAGWNHAADLGAGTGELSNLLLGNTKDPRVADRITAIDRTPEILAVAARRYGAHIRCMVGDVTQLGIQDASFDLMVSGGLAHSLGRDLQTPYFQEVERLLAPGGMYLDGDQNVWQRTVRNPGRSRLSSIIMWEAAGAEFFGDPLEGVDKRDYFSRLGLTFSERIIGAGQPAESPIVVRVLQK